MKQRGDIIAFGVRKETDRSRGFHPSTIIYENAIEEWIDIGYIAKIMRKSARRTVIYVERRGFESEKFIVNMSKRRVERILCGEESWQDEEFTFIEVERVYATRYDCAVTPERVRQAA